MTTNIEMMESVNHSMAIATLLTSYTKSIVHLDGNLYSPDLQKPWLAKTELEMTDSRK